LYFVLGFKKTAKIGKNGNFWKNNKGLFGVLCMYRVSIVGADLRVCPALGM
jgi:hypothetical protein